MQSTAGGVLAVAKAEFVRMHAVTSRRLLPALAFIGVALILVTVFTAGSGMHLQDGLYTAGTDDLEVAAFLAADERFTVYEAPVQTLNLYRDSLDLIVYAGSGEVIAAPTGRGQAAVAAFKQVYEAYRDRIYRQEDDIAAAYPLWLGVEYVQAEADLSFAVPAAGSGRPRDATQVTPIYPPSVDLSQAELRELVGEGRDQGALERFKTVIGPKTETVGIILPADLSPPMPLDSIVLIFVYIFPLYFISQFLMMSVMNERIMRAGEPLLSTPLRPFQIVAGKTLPYIGLMLLVSAAITVISGAPLAVLLPLVPVALFFSAVSFLAGMVARSFRELSFLSVALSTVLTIYLFVPSIFTSVPAIGMISPLTLVAIQLQGDAIAAADYLYATALFYLGSAAIFLLATTNFNEERLFSFQPLLGRMAAFISSLVSDQHPYLSIAGLSMLSIPFVFMAEFALLVAVFNLPVWLSAALLLVAAAVLEETAKSTGIYAWGETRDFQPGWRAVTAAALASGLGFMAGEKILLFAALSRLGGTVFGAVLFSGLGLLLLPAVLHVTGAFITAAALKRGGRRAYLPGLAAAAAVHSVYNIIIVWGVLP